MVWFALNDDRPLAAFAGIWTEFRVLPIRHRELDHEAVQGRT